ncbi:MAG: hypothetical protein KKD76_02630, partial [Verrucomicrobia bacterium]|nr:hypothetical protein [Verrucomicrobiota bacterium]
MTSISHASNSTASLDSRKDCRRRWLSVGCLGVFISAGLVATSLAAPDAAGDWFWRQRALPAASVPVGQGLSLRSMAKAGVVSATNNDTTWEAIGPAPILNCTMTGTGSTYSGRATAIAVHPLDPDTLLLGTAQGGIWRSTNSGQAFTPVADTMPSLAIKVIRFAPSNSNIVYAGSGEPHSKTSIFGMGVYKSVDAGSTWTALPNTGADWDFRYLSISGLQVNPTNADELVVTVADVLPDRVNVFQPPPTSRTGIFKSTDGGQTWRCVQTATDYRAYAFPAHDPYLSSGVGFMDLELYRANPAFLFATEYSGGIWRSTDGGETWLRITPVKNPGGGAAIGANFPTNVSRFSYFDGNSATFSNYLVLARMITTPELNRIELGLAQAGGTLTTNLNSVTLYAGCGTVLLLDVNTNGLYDPAIDFDYPMAVLFKSTNGGQAWTWMGDWYNEGVPAYCDIFDDSYEDALYDNTVEVNPANPDDVILGGNCNYASPWPDPISNPVRYLQTPWHGVVFRTVDGGSNWVDTTPAAITYVLTTNLWNGLPLYTYTEILTNKMTHPDVHAAAYDWSADRIYVAQDGGLSRVTLTGTGTNSFTDYNWADLNNGLGTLQFFQFGSHPNDPRVIQGGMQDNANACWNGTYWTAWDWAGGDGTIGKFDPLNPLTVYIGMQYSLYRADNGGSNLAEDWTLLFDSRIGSDTDLPFVTLMAIDPVNPTNIYVVSTSGLYGSTNRGDTWSGPLNSQALAGELTALDVSPHDTNTVWLGTSAGRIYYVDTHTRQATDVTGANLPNRWVSKIKASPNVRDTVYITLSGYDTNSLNVTNGGNGHAGHVFKSTDRGQTWSNLSGNLTRTNGFDLPVAALAVDPLNENRLWIGTDDNLLVTTNGGTNWADYSAGMPAVAVMDLEYNIRTRYLMAATFGRSIWRTIPDTVTDVSADFDGDGTTDLTVFQPRTGTWRTRLSGSDSNLFSLTNFGQVECTAVP